MQPSRTSNRVPFSALWSALALLVFGGSLRGQTPPATIPPGWYSGDTHTHIQLCGEPVDLTPEQIYAAVQSQHLSVACLQVWAKFGVTPAVYLADYAPLVTGIEHPVSAGDPDAIVQVGVEVSGFQASQFGHVQALNVQDGAFPTAAMHSKPVLDFFLAQPGAITGYAHVLWWDDYAPALIMGGGGSGPPFQAPLEVALGTVDFLEIRRVEELQVLTWRSFYYKLLNAGMRVALVGGSDNTCTFAEQIGETRTWARIVQEPLTFTRWCEAVAARATTVSDGSAVFLDLRVDGAPIGSELNLPSADVLPVRATLHVAAGESASGRLKLIQNGREVASEHYHLPAGGTAVLSLPVSFVRSSWIAASAEPNAHTGATFVSVGDRPIAVVKDARYWVEYCDDLQEQIGDFEVHAAEPEILARVAAARQIYSALEAVALPLPPGVVRYGHSTPACKGPIAIGVDAPPSVPFMLTCLNAPPDSAGTLLLGLADDSGGPPVSGADLFVSLSSPYVSLPARTNGGGYAEVPITLPSGSQFAAQFVWDNTESCGNGGPVSASDALEIQIP
jgi:hypothetical protein